MKKATLFHPLLKRKDDSKLHLRVNTRRKGRIIPHLSLLLLTCGLLLSACSQTRAANPTQQSKNPKQQPNNSGIYILSQTSLTSEVRITKIDVQTHKPLWHTQPTLSDVASMISDHLTITGDHIYLSLYASFNKKPAKNFVFAFSTEDGKELWHTEFEAYKHPNPNMPSLGWLTTPTADNQTVYVASSVGKVYGLDAKNGSLHWTYDSKMEGIFCPTSDGKAQSICPSWSNDYASIEQLTLSQGIIYGGIKNRFYAVDAAKGTLLWSNDLPANHIVYRPIAIDGKHAFVVDCTAFALNSCSLHAYTADTGAPIWHTTDRSHNDLSQLTIENHTIYALSEGNLDTPISGTGVYAWNETDGKQLWHYATPKDVLRSSIGGPLLIADNQIYIGQLCVDDLKHGEYMFRRLALNATTGTIRWQLPKAYVAAENGDLRAISEQTIYAGSHDTLFAYEATDGSKLWQYTFAPILPNDRLSIYDIAVIPSAS